MANSNGVSRLSREPESLPAEPTPSDSEPRLPPDYHDLRDCLDEVAAVVAGEARPKVKIARLSLTLSAAEEKGLLSSDLPARPEKELPAPALELRARLQYARRRLRDLKADKEALEQRIDALRDELQSCRGQNRDLREEVRGLANALRDVKGAPGVTMDWKHLARYRREVAEEALEESDLA